jgi:uncharacterized protein
MYPATADAARDPRPRDAEAPRVPDANEPAASDGGAVVDPAPSPGEPDGGGPADLPGQGSDAPQVDAAPIDNRPAEPPPQDDPSLATGAKAYLRFDDTPQNQTWRDSSGSGNPALMRGADVQASLSQGRYDTGLRLLGGAAGGWLEMASSNSFNDIVHGLSIAAWIFRTGDDGDGTILSRRSSSGSGQLYALEIVNNRLRARLNTAGGYNANLGSGGQPLPSDRWVHVALTYDERVLRLFVDGDERASMPYALGLPPELTPVLVGAAEPGTGGAPLNRLAATLDEVLVYGRALSNRDVAALAARSRPTAK